MIQPYWRWVSAEQRLGCVHSKRRCFAGYCEHTLVAPVMPAIMVVAMYRDKYREASGNGKNGQGDDKGSEDFLHGVSMWFRYTQVTPQDTGGLTRICKLVFRQNQ